MASRRSQVQTKTGQREASPIRIINKSGQANIKYVGIKGCYKSFFSDIFTTLIDLRWAWNMLFFCLGFWITWLLFALYYWVVSLLHGDFKVHLEDLEQPCITGTESFVSIFLFSIETQTTIGYGSRLVTEACPAVYIGVFIQSIVGAALQAALAGLVVAKVKRAKKRSNTVVFSSVACVVEEDGQLKLVIRVGDMRKSFIIQVHVMGYLFQKMTTGNGKTFPVRFQTLDFTGEDNNRQVFLAWPTQLVHVIDERSPLWECSREFLLRNNFELVIILDGTVTTTSMPFQAKKSYLAWDIRWGHRFETMRNKINEYGRNVIDFSNFHKTHAISMPWCSAKDLHDIHKRGGKIPRNSVSPPVEAWGIDKYTIGERLINDGYLDSSLDVRN